MIKSLKRFISDVLQKLFEPKTLFIVKVISHTKDHEWEGNYWWSHHIGEEFEIIKETDKHYITRRNSSQGMGIRKRDAIKITK